MTEQSQDFQLCLKRQEALLQKFAPAMHDPQTLYQKIMEEGNSLAPFDNSHKIEANRVRGCQSLAFLHSEYKDGRICFSGTADALISRGLIALLLVIYSDLEPLTILRCEPVCFKTLGLSDALSPTRAGGLAAMHLRFKQEALKVLA